MRKTDLMQWWETFQPSQVLGSMPSLYICRGKACLGYSFPRLHSCGNHCDRVDPSFYICSWVILSVEAVNSYIAWDFSLQQGALNMDIGFHVEYISPSGEKTLILPYRRYEADQGNFCTVSSGSYKLVWDNSYSSFFKKVLRYKVDAVPPVVEPALSATEL
ncbi:hypothetical protein ZEAMMB73_Zm00001d037808 [Zea mays]|uniref:Uncharacterized protein n=1 Tax=Zea mays TaxID=4577 RepID=A0A1D6M0L0_MAIZE|nr:hypothetical protein ZEAMMB73_Zm00001d037808 [Zea mays]